MQSRHCGVKKKRGNNERGRPFARQPRDRGQHPQECRDNSYVETSDSEKVKRSGLLERFLDVFRCLVPESKHDSTEKILHLRRVLQPSAKRVLHPGARYLCRMQDRASTAVANQRAVFRITNKQHATNIPPRKIGAHIEFARIARRRDDFRSSEKPQCIAKFRGSAPADPPDRVCRLFPAFEFN